MTDSQIRGMVLCAGLGTRLRPLTERWPKPALPLLGQPLLRTTFAVLKRVGVAAVGINTHHLPEVMSATADEEARRAGLALSVVHEPLIQGTGGGIRGLRALLSESEVFVVFNGDILFPVDLAPIVAVHRSMRAAASMVLQNMPVGQDYAAVECDGSGAVRRIAGHGPGGEKLTPWHFTGVHVMSPAVFDFMSSEGPEDINRQVYVRMMEAGLRIQGIPTPGYWSDLGTPARYLSTVDDLLSGQVPRSGWGTDSPFVGAREREPGCWVRGSPHIEGTLVGPVFVDDNARVGKGAVGGPSAYLGRSAVLGAGSHFSHGALLEGAEVREGTRMTRAIVWHGGSVSAAL